MLTNESKRKLASLGVFALPVGIVIVAGSLLGPAGAEAGEMLLAPAVTNAGATPGVTDVTLTEPVAAAQAHVEQLDGASFGMTPLYHPVTGEARVVVEIDNPEAAPPPKFKIKAIMSSRRGNTALIDGRALRVGDSIGDSGWVILEIDATARSVTIEDPKTDRTAVRHVDAPALPGFQPGQARPRPDQRDADGETAPAATDGDPSDQPDEGEAGATNDAGGDDG